MNISIKKPCHEDWTKMTPNEKGAFCTVCTKDVVDFSNKTISEIKQFFAKPIIGKVCGRFKEDQLAEMNFDGFFANFSGFKLTKKVLIVVALSFASWFFTANELSAQTTNTHKVGKIKVVNTETVTPTNHQNNNVKGMIITTPKDTTKCIKKGTETMKMGEVAVPPKKQKKVSEKQAKPIKTKQPKNKNKENNMLLGDVMIDESNKK